MSDQTLGVLIMSLSLVVLMVIYYRSKVRMASRIERYLRETQLLSQQGRRVSWRLEEEQRLSRLARGKLIGVGRGFLTERERELVRRLGNLRHD